MGDLDAEQRSLIPHAQRELTYHCALKGFQLGPFVAVMFGAPFYGYRLRKNFTFPTFFHRLGKATIYTTAVTVPLSLGLMFVKLNGEDFNEYKIWDRAYRIRYSASQQRADQFSYGAAAIGSSVAFASALPRRFQLSSAGKGALIAVPFGIIAHVLTFPKTTKKTDEKPKN